MFLDIKQGVGSHGREAQQKNGGHRVNSQKKSEAQPAIGRSDKRLWRGKNKEMRGTRTGGHSQVAASLPIQFSPNLTRK